MEKINQLETLTLYEIKHYYEVICLAFMNICEDYLKNTKCTIVTEDELNDFMQKYLDDANGAVGLDSVDQEEMLLQ